MNELLSFLIMQFSFYFFNSPMPFYVVLEPFYSFFMDNFPDGSSVTYGIKHFVKFLLHVPDPVLLQDEYGIYKGLLTYTVIWSYMTGRYWFFEKLVFAPNYFGVPYIRVEPFQFYFFLGDANRMAPSLAKRGTVIKLMNGSETTIVYCDTLPRPLSKTAFPDVGAVKTVNPPMPANVFPVSYGSEISKSTPMVGIGVRIEIRADSESFWPFRVVDYRWRSDLYWNRKGPTEGDGRVDFSKYEPGSYIKDARAFFEQQGWFKKDKPLNSPLEFEYFGFRFSENFDFSELYDLLSLEFSDLVEALPVFVATIFLAAGFGYFSLLTWRFLKRVLKKKMVTIQNFLNYPLLLSTFTFIALIFLSFVPNNSFLILRSASLWLSVFIFLFSLCGLFFLPEQAALTFFSLSSADWLAFWNINYFVGVDAVSLYFIILSTFLTPICILASWESIKYRMKEFLLLLFFTQFCLINVFSVLDLLLFYIFFEAVIIPMFIIIGVWGSRLRRIAAAFRFFLYTLVGSVIMLLALIYIYSQVGSFNLYSVYSLDLPLSIQLPLWLAFFCSFAVKIPMMPFHVWLPEAHVEAPTAGSVLLAGILLKLGGYGFLRFSIPVFPEASTYFAPFVFLLSLFAIIYGSLTTIVQIDLKKIVAYSSVAHMNYVTLGLFTNSLEGIEGAIFLMLSHGLVSSALFLCVGFLYDRHGSRLLGYYGGLATLMPLYSFFFFLFTMANMGLPGTSSFVGEFLVLLGCYSVNTVVVFFGAVGVILSAVYNVWFFNRLCFGPVSAAIFKYSDVNSREFFILAVLAVFVIFFGIWPNFIFSTLHLPVSALLF